MSLEYDWHEAVHWALKAAEQDNPIGFLMLGDAYIRSSVPDYDPQKALFYYHKAAEMGCAQAWWVLAETYRNGILVQQDFVRSLAYYIIADKALLDINNILEDGIRGMSSLLNKEEYAQSWVLAKELWGAGPWNDYEPLKYMNYFNPQGPVQYWHKRWN